MTLPQFESKVSGLIREALGPDFNLPESYPSEIETRFLGSPEAAARDLLKEWGFTEEAQGITVVYEEINRVSHFPRGDHFYGY